MLDDAHSSVILTSAIRTVIGLGLEGEDMCFILARVSLSEVPHFLYSAIWPIMLSVIQTSHNFCPWLNCNHFIATIILNSLELYSKKDSQTKIAKHSKCAVIPEIFTIKPSKKLVWSPDGNLWSILHSYCILDCVFDYEIEPVNFFILCLQFVKIDPKNFIPTFNSDNLIVYYFLELAIR